jgi:hypothetical protein
MPEPVGRAPARSRALQLGTALLVGATSILVLHGGADAATTAKIAAFCKAETYVAHFDTNGATLYGDKGVPLTWSNVADERSELTKLDQAQATAARDAPTAQLVEYSKQLSTQFVAWLQDANIVTYYTKHTGQIANTALASKALAAFTQASYVMESHTFTDPVEQYCPALRPPASGTDKAPHLNNYPAYDTTPVAVQVSSFVNAVSFSDELNKARTAFADPSLSHLRAVLAEYDGAAVRIDFVGTPKSVGGPKSKDGQYYWDIDYRASTAGETFLVEVHLDRPKSSKDSTAQAAPIVSFRAQPS